MTWILNRGTIKQQIKKDIEAYQGQLCKIQQQLDELPPTGRIPYEGRKLKRARQKLQAEIEHIKTLISYAEEAF